MPTGRLGKFISIGFDERSIDKFFYSENVVMSPTILSCDSYLALTSLITYVFEAL